MSLDCYLRRENNQQCVITYGYTDNLSALAVVPFWDYLRFVIFFDTCGLLTVTYNIQDLPHIVCRLLSSPL